MSRNGMIIFKPFFVQQGRGPHLSDLVYTVDEHNDTFLSGIGLTEEGVAISDTKGQKRFSVYVRWNVEGYGFLFMPADNNGEGYELPHNGINRYHLNYELAKTRVKLSGDRLQLFESEGWRPSRTVKSYMDLSRTYLEDAENVKSDPQACAYYSQQALMFGLLAGELIAFEKAQSDIRKSTPRSQFYFGCDTRAFFQMDQKLFFEKFTSLFNYATITHYLIGDAIDFEPQEGHKRFIERSHLCDELMRRNITVEGRPLFWTHSWVTPEWLAKKNFEALKLYLEKHIRNVVGYYGDRIKVWEVVNELHDWANELQLNPDQCVEITRFACEVAHDANPNIRLLINNCCPFAEYVQLGKWHQKKALYPQRTPLQFLRTLLEADVDFDIIGAQVYFVNRPIADVISMIERFEGLGRQVHLAEVGAPSRGILQEFHEQELDFSTKPYEWRRHWDEELQADWMEQIFTYAYSRPNIEAANWYDFLDPFGFLKYGGLLRRDTFEPKAAFDRLQRLQQQLCKSE
ncbi:MAG: hypothetical protein EHM72_15205 [Calditrichaeota bacterium]|nr:MAG: hypothetical protein EHM72_15205 [Calditrichota bacterium]